MKRESSRTRIPIALLLTTIALAALAAVPTALIGGAEGIAMMGLGAGAGLLTVLGGYSCVQLAFRGPDRFAVKLVVGGFVVRMALVIATLAVLAATTDIDPTRFVLWLVAFHFVLVIAEAWILSRDAIASTQGST